MPTYRFISKCVYEWLDKMAIEWLETNGYGLA
jgi:hypothetical protein